MEFYRDEPTARTSWRLSVLMGANSRTYKFALAHALLEMAHQGRDSVTLLELAVPYSLAIAEHALRSPQASTSVVLGAGDFLSVVNEEARESVDLGAPTERLARAAADSMPGMVMQKFHNLRGQGQVVHTFYEVNGRGPGRRVILTPSLRDVAASQAQMLSSELQARWSIVETAFAGQLGQSLLGQVVVLSDDGTELLSHTRRAPVAGARSSLSGFQHGRCFYCQEPLDQLEAVPHVDHVFPFVLMRSGSWRGPSLNGLWNLVVACAPCNLAKSTRPPTTGELERLVARNEAIMTSPHPLRRSLEASIAPGNPSTTVQERVAFIRSVDAATPWGEQRLRGGND